jgi:hypothetical protein
MKIKKLSKQQKTALIFSISIFSVLLGFVIYVLLREKSEKIKTGSNVLDNIINTVTGAYSNENFPLAMYSQGERIKVVQRKMNEWFAKNKTALIAQGRYSTSHIPLSVDGKWGVHTEFAVSTYFPPADGKTPHKITETEYNTLKDNTF